MYYYEKPFRHLFLQRKLNDRCRGFRFGTECLLRSVLLNLRSCGNFLYLLGEIMTRNPIPKVLSIFFRHRVKALLIGGQACILYGAAEFSRDIDLAVMISAENLDEGGSRFTVELPVSC